jgi:hypothetical protein
MAMSETSNPVSSATPKVEARRHTPTALPLIPIGATATVVGIALCLLLDPTFGGVVVVSGILAQAWGLHRLGRGSG